MKSSELYEKIEQMLNQGYYQNQIAKELGIAQSRVSLIINSKVKKRPSKRQKNIFSDFVSGKTFKEVEEKYSISFWEVKDILLDERFYE